MTDEQLMEALRIDDSYRVVRVLAERPSGRTELVRGTGTDLLVRKRIPAELANEPAWRELSSLRHPLLPQVRNLYWLPDQLVVITTYVDGVTLAELVDQSGPLAPADAVLVIRDLCEAVAELHAHGIVHRDLTPSNAVMASGRARVIDLGNARTYVEGAEHDTTRLGTWGFAAPEQYGFAQTDARSDVYALGGLLGYLLTGLRPDAAEFTQVLRDEQRVSPALRRVVEKARSFEPSARYQSVADLATDARGALAGVMGVTGVAGGSGSWQPVERAAEPSLLSEMADQMRRAQEWSNRNMARSLGWWGQGASSSWDARDPDPWPIMSPSLAWRLFKTGIVAALWFLALFVSSAGVYALFSPSQYKSAFDYLYYPGSILSVVLAVIAATWEVTMAILGRGRYSSRSHVVVRLLAHIALYVVGMFLAMFALYLVGNLLFPYSAAS